MHTAEKAQCEVGKAVAAVCEGAFFNREAELRSLNATLADYPTAVLVLTGPPSCGKSGTLSVRFLVLRAVCRVDVPALQRC